MTPSWLTARPIAHRGLHDAPAGIVENTIAAAEAAIAHGYGIECDVQDTADGEAVVFHDHTLDRLTGERGPVRERRAAQLSGLFLAGTAEAIPTLAEFLARIGGRVPLVVEIKSRFDGSLALARRTCEIALTYPGPLAIESFDPAVVAEVRRLAPGLPRGIVAESRYTDPDWVILTPQTKFALANLLHLDETAPDFLSWNVADLPCAATFLCRRLGHIPVTTWTVRSEDDRHRAAAHADQMVFEGFRPD